MAHNPTSTRSLVMHRICHWLLSNRKTNAAVFPVKQTLWKADPNSNWKRGCTFWRFGNSLAIVRQVLIGSPGMWATIVPLKQSHLAEPMMESPYSTLINLWSATQWRGSLGKQCLNIWKSTGEIVRSPSLSRESRLSRGRNRKPHQNRRESEAPEEMRLEMNCKLWRKLQKSCWGWGGWGGGGVAEAVIIMNFLGSHFFQLFFSFLQESLSR